MYWPEASTELQRQRTAMLSYHNEAIRGPKSNPCLTRDAVNLIVR